MNLFVNSVIEHKIVVGQDEWKKCGDTIETECDRKISFLVTLVSHRKFNGVIAVDGFLVSKETAVLHRWERSKQKFGFVKRVDKGLITTIKDLES